MQNLGKSAWEFSERVQHVKTIRLRCGGSCFCISIRTAENAFLLLWDRVCFESLNRVSFLFCLLLFLSKLSLSAVYSEAVVESRLCSFLWAPVWTGPGRSAQNGPCCELWPLPLRSVYVSSPLLTYELNEEEGPGLLNSQPGPDGQIF